MYIVDGWVTEVCIFNYPLSIPCEMFTRNSLTVKHSFVSCRSIHWLYMYNYSWWPGDRGVYI